MPELSIKNFILGATLSAITGISIISLSLYFGKSELFLLLNNDWGKLADQIFVFATYLGDGTIWIPVALYVLLFRKKYTILLLGSIIYSTLFAQITKHFIFPGVLRPTRMISDLSLIHTVPGVEINSFYSFPSGHTTTVFTIYLLFCLLLSKKWIVPVGFLSALVVGYSRIYLAQHFPIDVGAGMIAGLISVYFSLRLQNWKDQYFNQSK